MENGTNDELGVININQSLYLDELLAFYENQSSHLNEFIKTFHDIWYWRKEIDLISFYVILPIIVLVGLAVNIIAFCVWMCGSKSKSMCCAIYFAANSTADFLFLTEPLLWVDKWGFGIIQKTDFTCKLFTSFYNSCMHLSTCISAIITIERSLTVLFPFVFKSQSMRARSKIVLLVLLVLQPFVQFIPLLYNEMGRYDCMATQYSWEYSTFFYAIVCILLPFVVILTFNVATVATLIRHRLRRQPVAGRQDHVHVFTKLTLITGVSFVLSYILMAIHVLYHMIIGVEINVQNVFQSQLFMLTGLSATMLYLNSVMNPIICFIVCKCVRDDIKQFLTAVARMIRRNCTCRSSQQEIRASNFSVSTRATKHVEMTPRNMDTGEHLNVAATSV